MSVSGRSRKGTYGGNDDNPVGRQLQDLVHERLLEGRKIA